MVNNVDGEIYVGSTANGLRKRKNAHKSLAKKSINTPVYRHLNEVGWENVPSLVLIEEYPCDTKQQLFARERYWIDLLQPSLNKTVPCLIEGEYRNKRYYDKNVLEILEKQKIYRAAPEIKTRTAEYHKEYRSQHNDLIKAVKNKKSYCPCGGRFTHCHKALHLRTARHKTYEESILNQ